MVEAHITGGIPTPWIGHAGIPAGVKWFSVHDIDIAFSKLEDNLVMERKERLHEFF